MDPAQAKQQIAERVKQASKFLVTVNANPTVDQLAACIGLTLMLNKMGKHATAVFSGKVPNTLEFLQPDKTLQKNTDALRDFIISLDKNKADKLRYKVENDVVRIFITPYRSSISEKDLVFSEGDFNVEAVLALGVTQQGQLDAAITAHGKILHDASVITVNVGQPKPGLGQINWFDPSASSLSEMLVSISEAFGSGLIDSQIATAFLTGIVAETARFSNPKTSPKVMTISAQLMAAGANQQLIAEKLAPPPPPPPSPPPSPAPPKNPPPAAPPKKPNPPPKPKQPPLKPEGVIDVPHEGDKKDGGTDVDLGTTEIHIDEQGNLLMNQPAPPPEKPLNFTDNKLGEVPLQMQDTTVTPPAAALPPEETLPELPEPTLTTTPLPAPPAPTPPSPNPIAGPAVPPLPPPPQIVSTPALPPIPVEPPEGHHTFLGTTAQPASVGIPFSSGNNQPDWAAPYDLVPMDPMAGESTGSEFGSSQAKVNPEKSQGNFGQGHGIAPPTQVPVEPAPPQLSDLDTARTSVAQAMVPAPPAAPQAPNYEPPPAALNLPPLPTTDTPMMVLPSGGAGPVTTTAVSGVAPAAPPPVPPPLMTAPGAVVPNLPPLTQ